jgi:hypothetical protein
MAVSLALCAPGVLHALPPGATPKPHESKPNEQRSGGHTIPKIPSPELKDPVKQLTSARKQMALEEAKAEDQRNQGPQEPQASRASREAEYLRREDVLAQEWGLRIGADQRYRLSSHSRATALLMQMRARNALQQATRTARLQVFRTTHNRFERLASSAWPRWHAHPHLVLVANAGSPSQPGSAAPIIPNETLVAAAQAAVEDLLATAFGEVALNAAASRPRPGRGDLLLATLQRLRACVDQEQLDRLKAQPVSEAAGQGAIALRDITSVQRISGDDVALLVNVRFGGSGSDGTSLAVRLPLDRVLENLVTDRL